jgi:glycosyltransferase involved in cell wall biosynthesis
VPVVTTNVYGPKEIITDGVDGLAVNPDNVVELVEAIRRLLDNEEFRMKIGENGRKTVEERFDIKIHLESLSGIYQDLIGK